MKKVNITLTFDDERLDALEFSLRKENSSVQERMDDALQKLYEKAVAEPVREYLDSRAAPAAKEKPRRPAKATSKAPVAPPVSTRPEAKPPAPASAGALPSSHKEGE